jgi:ankyrin repeat protein
MDQSLIQLYTHCREHEDVISNPVRFWGRLAFKGTPNEGSHDNVCVWAELCRHEEIYRKKHHTQEGEAMVFVAAKKGVDYVIQKAIEFGVGLDFRNHNGRTPIYASIKHVNSSVAGLLMHNGCDLNTQDNNKETPLLYAIRLKSLLVANRLAMITPNFECLDRYNYTALFNAISKGFEPLVETLLKRGASITSPFPGHVPAIALAACCGNKAIFSMLMSAPGADPFFVFDDGDSLLDVAVKRGNLVVMETLLEAGLDPNRINEKTGMVTFHCACKTNYPVYLQMLLRYGANLTLKDSDAKDAVDYAVESSTEKTIAFILNTLY